MTCIESDSFYLFLGLTLAILEGIQLNACVALIGSLEMCTKHAHNTSIRMESISGRVLGILEATTDDRRSKTRTRLTAWFLKIVLVELCTWQLTVHS